jgi:hypothetical protein
VEPSRYNELSTQVTSVLDPDTWPDYSPTSVKSVFGSSHNAAEATGTAKNIYPNTLQGNLGAFGLIVEQGTGRYSRLVIAGNGGGIGHVTVDFNDMSVTVVDNSSGGDTYGYADLITEFGPNGGKLAWIVISGTDSGSTWFKWDADPNSTGTSICHYGCAYDQEPDVCSPHPSTKNGDYAEIDLGDWWNETEGTFYVDYRYTRRDGRRYPRVIDLKNATAYVRRSTPRNGNDSRLVLKGANYIDYSNQYYGATAWIQFTMSWDPNTVEWWVNGISQGTHTNDGFADGTTAIQFTTGNQEFNEYRDVRFWPERLSSDQQKVLTS